MHAFPTSQDLRDPFYLLPGGISESLGPRRNFFTLHVVGHLPSLTPHWAGTPLGPPAENGPKSAEISFYPNKSTRRTSGVHETNPNVGFFGSAVSKLGLVTFLSDFWLFMNFHSEFQLKQASQLYFDHPKIDFWRKKWFFTSNPIHVGQIRNIYIFNFVFQKQNRN